MTIQNDYLDKVLCTVDCSGEYLEISLDRFKQHGAIPRGVVVANGPLVPRGYQSSEGSLRGSSLKIWRRGVPEKSTERSPPQCQGGKPALSAAY